MNNSFIEGFEKRAKEYVRGGKADGKPSSDFPQDQISKGKKVEMEHTDNPNIAEEISRDHLTEDKKYYTHLKEMEDKYVKKGSVARGLLSGLLGVSDLSAETIARRAGTGIRRTVVPATVAGTTAKVVSDRNTKTADVSKKFDPKTGKEEEVFSSRSGEGYKSFARRFREQLPKAK